MAGYAMDTTMHLDRMHHQTESPERCAIDRIAEHNR
jgi:hypothetical protein